jgi:hypothetical protein
VVQELPHGIRRPDDGRSAGTESGVMTLLPAIGRRLQYRQTHAGL